MGFVLNCADWFVMNFMQLINLTKQIILGRMKKITDKTLNSSSLSERLNLYYTGTVTSSTVYSLGQTEIKREREREREREGGRERESRK